MGLPNLEKGGWRPRAHWAASTPEQQRELDIRYSAEQIVDESHETWLAIGGVTTDEPQEPHDREESIQRTIALMQAEESYANRSLPDIVRDGLACLDEARKETDGHYRLRHTLEREADSLLTRLADNEVVSSDIDPKLMSLMVQWASIEFFAYRHYRYWDVDDHTKESALELIGKAGLSPEDFIKLCQEPIDAEAKRLYEEEGYNLERANQSVIEAQLLDRAQELGIEVGKVHGYVAYLSALGI